MIFFLNPRYNSDRIVREGSIKIKHSIDHEIGMFYLFISTQFFEVGGMHYILDPNFLVYFYWTIDGHND